MGLWEHPAIRKRMKHLAQQRAKRPGSAAEKVAALELMGVSIPNKRPDLPAFYFQDYYQSKIFTPQKPKGKDDERLTGERVTRAVLEMSLWAEPVCGITWQHLQNAYDISHTLAFQASDSLRHSYECISGQLLDSMHVDSRYNKFILSKGVHGLDTAHTLLRFPVFIMPDGEPVLAPRVASIIDWNTKYGPAERRNGFAELPPIIGAESPGILYWALEADTDLEYVTHYNLDGLNPYQSPIKYGSFYYSNEDPFAVICNTAENISILEKHGRLKIDHLCQWGQDLIDDFSLQYALPITNGSLDKDHNKYYAALPLPPRPDDDEEEDEPPQPPPTYAESPSSTAPDPPTPSNYSDESDLELDNQSPSSPSPVVRLKDTRAMTLDDRIHGAKVKKALMEERLRKKEEVNERIEREEEERKHERSLRSEDLESKKVEREKERKHAKHRARMERAMDALRYENTKHDYFALVHCAEKDGNGDCEPARFKMLQESRQHQRAYVAAAKEHYRVTRSKTKAIRSELAPLEGEPSFQEWVDGWKANHRFPSLPRLENLAVEDMAPPPPEPEPETDVFVDATASLPTASTNSFALPTVTVASESDDTTDDTSDMPTPTMRTRSLDGLVFQSGVGELDTDEGTDERAPSEPPSEPTPSEPPVAASHQPETETVASSDTVNTGSPLQAITAFTFTHRIVGQSSTGPSQPATSTVAASGNSRRGGTGSRELRGHGRHVRVAGPSLQTAGRSGTHADRGRTRHATDGHSPPPRRSARQAARNAEQTDTGNFADPDTGKKRKAPASDPDKGYDKKMKKRRGDGGQ